MRNSQAMGNPKEHDRSRTAQEQSVVDFLKRSKLAAIPPLKSAADSSQSSADRDFSQD